MSDLGVGDDEHGLQSARLVHVLPLDEDEVVGAHSEQRVSLEHPTGDGPDPGPARGIGHGDTLAGGQWGKDEVVTYGRDGPERTARCSALRHRPPNTTAATSAAASASKPSRESVFTRPTNIRTTPPEGDELHPRRISVHDREPDQQRNPGRQHGRLGVRVAERTGQPAR